MKTKNLLEVEDVPLKVADRCDRCGAQAYVRAHYLNGELLFCGHHYEKFKNGIEESAFKIQDERDRISQS